jgi:hypothetical protein
MRLFIVMPVKTGIQPRAYAIRPYKNSWIPGRASLPGMTFELCCAFLEHHSEVVTRRAFSGRVDQEFLPPELVLFHELPLPRELLGGR